MTKWTTERIREEGVVVKPGVKIDSMIGESDKVILNFKSGEKLEADYVVMAVGLGPNTDLAKHSGLGMLSLYNFIRVG